LGLLNDFLKKIKDDDMALCGIEEKWMIMWLKEMLENKASGVLLYKSYRLPYILVTDLVLRAAHLIYSRWYGTKDIF